LIDFCFEETTSGGPSARDNRLVADRFEFGHEVVVFVAERSEERADELVLVFPPGPPRQRQYGVIPCQRHEFVERGKEIVLHQAKVLPAAAVMTSGQKRFQCTAVCGCAFV